MPCSYSYLQENFYNWFDGEVSITVVLKVSVNKVEASSPSKTFFFCFRKYAGFFSRFTCLQKKYVFMYYAHVKWLHPIKWRSLYEDRPTATMQELLLKTYTSSAWRKRSLEGNCHCIVYGTGLQHSQALADLPQKRWRRHRTNRNNQSNHRHLRRRCNWMTLTRVLYGGPSTACTPWRRFCRPLITWEQDSSPTR